MILRILRGRAERRDLASLLAAVRADIDDWAAINAGLEWAQPAFQQAPSGLEFLLASTWADVESVIARGGEVTLPRGKVGASGLLRDGQARHYELMMGVARDDPRPGEVLRLSTIELAPRSSSAFYARMRELWNQLVDDAGLVSIHVGRKVDAQMEQAVVVSMWENEAALQAATGGGLVGGEQMAAFYVSEPVIEQFTTLTLEPRDAVPA